MPGCGRPTRRQTRGLLDLFLLDKALGEIEYELTNRPSWADIPIEATLRMLEQRGVIATEAQA